MTIPLVLCSLGFLSFLCSPEHQPLTKLHDDLVDYDAHDRKDDQSREYTRRVVEALLLQQEDSETALRGHELAQDRAEVLVAAGMPFDAQEAFEQAA